MIRKQKHYMDILRRFAILVMVLGLGLGAACTPLAPPTYLVTANLANSTDIPLEKSLQIAYTGAANTATRLVASENMGFTYLQTANLSVTRGGTSIPNTDAYILQVISQPSAYVNQVPDGKISLAGDWGWMNAHSSDLFVLELQPTSLDDPTTIATPNLDPRRGSVSAWLTVEEEDDPVLPFSVAPGSSGCQLIPFVSPADCFDVQSIATLLLSGVTNGLRTAVDPSNGGPDPNPLVRATKMDSSISFVPNIVHSGMNNATRRVRGVGFIIRLSFDARAAGGTGAIGPLPVDVGTPYHRVTVLVPIAIHFEDDGTGQLLVTIDPVDLAGSLTASEMTPHIAVEVQNPLGTPIDNAAGQAIADTVTGVVTAQLSASGPLADLASGGLAAFFNLVRPTRALPANFDVVLIGGGSAQGVPETINLSGVPGASGPRLVFLE